MFLFLSRTQWIILRNLEFIPGGKKRIVWSESYADHQTFDNWTFGGLVGWLGWLSFFLSFTGAVAALRRTGERNGKDGNWPSEKLTGSGVAIGHHFV